MLSLFIDPYSFFQNVFLYIFLNVFQLPLKFSILLSFNSIFLVILYYLDFQCLFLFIFTGLAYKILLNFFFLVLFSPFFTIYYNHLWISFHLNCTFFFHFQLVESLEELMLNFTTEKEKSNLIDIDKRELAVRSIFLKCSEG